MDDLSPRARRWLKKVGCRRDEAVRNRGAEAVGRYPEFDPALADFEERYGGLVVDAKRRNVQLGLGWLLQIPCEPEQVDDPRRIEVGMEADADLWLDAAGRLWMSGPDRDVGELATTVKTYLERLAAGAVAPNFPYTIYSEAVGPELVRALKLKVDPVASDDTFLRASSKRHVLEACLRGTEWRRSWALLRCRDYGAWIAALTTASAKIKGWRATPSPWRPSIRIRRVDQSLAPSAADLETELSAGSVLRIPGHRGGATFLYEKPRRAAHYGQREDGSISDVTRFGPRGGRRTDYVVPWPR